MLAVTRSIRRSISAAPGRTAARRTLAMQQQQQRAFASEPTIKRPRAIKVKKSEARRRIEPKSEAESQQHALTEAPQAQPPTPFAPYEQSQEPVTFGQVLKSNFLFGIGMALGFSLIGAVISAMEETFEPGKFDASDVVVGSATDETEA